MHVLQSCVCACRLSFFDSIKYVIGEQEYSANDMEHGVLRGNKASPTNPWVLIGLPKFSSGYFKAEDARTALVSNSCNRVHSAFMTCSLVLSLTRTF